MDCSPFPRSMAETPVLGGRILIIDDQENNVRILERMLRKVGYDELVSTTDPRTAIPLFLEHRPDLILLDLHMPYLDGFGVLEQVSPHVPEGTYLPILVLTADISTEAKQRALTMGAKDFLAKPFDSTEVLLRIKNLLEARFLYLALQQQNESLEVKVQQRTHELEEAQVEILERLGARGRVPGRRDAGAHAACRASSRRSWRGGWACRTRWSS